MEIGYEDRMGAFVELLKYNILIRPANEYYISHKLYCNDGSLNFFSNPYTMEHNTEHKFIKRK